MYQRTRVLRVHMSVRIPRKHAYARTYVEYVVCVHVAVCAGTCVCLSKHGIFVTCVHYARVFARVHKRVG